MSPPVSHPFMTLEPTGLWYFGHERLVTRGCVVIA
jgi:hypothetical protein